MQKRNIHKKYKIMAKASGSTRIVSSANAASSRKVAMVAVKTNGEIDNLINKINSYTYWDEKVKLLKDDAANKNVNTMTQVVSAVWGLSPSQFKNINEKDDVTYNKKKEGDITWDKYREDETDSIRVGTIARNGKTANIVRTYEESGFNSLVTYYINGYKTGSKDKSIIAQFDKLVKSGKIK